MLKKKKRHSLIHSFLKYVVNVVHVGLFFSSLHKKLGLNLTKGEWKGGPKKTFFSEQMLAFSKKKSLKYLYNSDLLWTSITALLNRIIMEEDRTLLFTCFQVQPLTTVRFISNVIWREAIPNPSGL